MINNFTGAEAPSLSAAHPLQALRRAQAAAYGGEGWCSDAICEARIGSEFGATEEEEAFIQTAIQWVCQHQDDIAEPGRLRLALDFSLEMYRLKEGDYKLAGRTPNKLYQAMEAYSLSTVEFEKEDDERFQSNPVGIKGYWVENATIPEGTALYVPYEGKQTDIRRNVNCCSSQAVRQTGRTVFLSSADKLDPEQIEELKYQRAYVRPPPPKMTVRIAEIQSMQRLFHEGAMLGNCLEVRQETCQILKLTQYL